MDFNWITDGTDINGEHRKIDGDVVEYLYFLFHEMYENRGGPADPELANVLAFISGDIKNKLAGIFLLPDGLNYTGMLDAMFSNGFGFGMAYQQWLDKILKGEKDV